MAMDEAMGSRNKDKNQQKGSGSHSRPFFIPQTDVVRLQTPIKGRFRVLLNRLGRSQNWLAGEVGISTGTMSRIANGLWFPATEVMTRICEILDVQSHVLFGDSKNWRVWSDKMIYNGGKNGNS